MAKNAVQGCNSAFIFDFFGFTCTTPFANALFLLQNCPYYTVNGVKLLSISWINGQAVSYTHLDVYKRQDWYRYADRLGQIR